MGKTVTSIERLLHRIEGHTWEERESTRVREEEVQAYRGKLQAEEAEREKLLVQVGSDEETAQRSLEEICKKHRVEFVVHSEEAVKALGKFAGEGARLVRVIPGSGSVQRDAGVNGSWLVFE